MTIEVAGPDGSSFQFPDGTAEATITGALSQHYGAAPKPADGAVSPEVQARVDKLNEGGAGEVRSMIRGGVPLIGGPVSKYVGAALSTAAGRGGFSSNLSDEDIAAKQYAEQHGIKDTVLGGIGGTLAFGGAAGAIPGAARIMGMSGPLWEAAPQAAKFFGGLGAGEAAVHGDNIGEGAVKGALTGGASVVGGHLLGRAAGGVKRLFSGVEPAPQRFLHVNEGSDPIPISAATESRDPRIGMEEQNITGGTKGEAAQKIGLASEAQTRLKADQAHNDVVAGLDPTGQSPNSTPLEAGKAAAGDLVDQEAARAAAEVQRIEGAASEKQAISAGVEPIGPQQRPIPSDVQPAGQMISEGLGRRQDVERANTKAAYGVRNNVQGEFQPRHLLGAGEDIRMQLNSGPDPVRVNPEVPTAQKALRVIDDEIAQLKFTNDVARGARPITPADMDQVRRHLLALNSEANVAARTSGNFSDVFAMGRVLDEFDNFVARTARRPGGFTGNPEEYLAADKAARAQHAYERGLFSKQGGKDKVGATMESILGSHGAPQMSPDKIIETVLGSPTNPGGVDHAVDLLNRLKSALGESSPEWAALKKAAITHFTEPVPGMPDLTPEKQAQRMAVFLRNERHSGAIFSPEEHAALSAHAQKLGAVMDPVAGRGTIQQKIDILSGRVTGEGASGTKLMNELFDENKGPALARELEQKLPPEKWGKLKQGVFQEISREVENGTPLTYLKMAKNIRAFLATEMAKTMFTSMDRLRMENLAGAYEKLIALPKTVNTSNTTYAGAEVAKGMKKQIFGSLGLHMGGLPGAVAGYAVGKAAGYIGDKRNAAKAIKLFYGQQPRGPVSQVPQRALVPLAQSLRIRGGNEQTQP